MNIDFLDPDEVLIECSIRNLSDASNRDITEALKQALNEVMFDEGESPLLVPQIAHEAARKRPRAEAAICADKLLQLKQLLQEQSTKEEDDSDLMKKVCSKLIHIRGRLTRLASSPAVKNDISDLFRASKNIQNIISAALVKKKTLNDSARDIEKVYIPIIDPTEDNDNNIASPALDPGHISTPSSSKSVTHYGNPGGWLEPYTNHDVANGNGKNTLNYQNLKHSQSNSKKNQHMRYETPGQKPRQYEEPIGHSPSRYGFKERITQPDDQSHTTLPLDAKICKDPSSWNLKFGGTRSALHVE